MQREIKFRTWDAGNKKMIGPYEMGSHYAEVYGYNDDDFTVMQHWGRKDINGIDIYEGDICHDSCFDEEGPLQVVFKDDGFYFVDLGGDHLMFDDLTGIVVVGNKYDNPELLK